MRFKGKGEHSVNQLENIIIEKEKELNEIKQSYIKLQEKVEDFINTSKLGGVLNIEFFVEEFKKEL